MLRSLSTLKLSGIYTQKHLKQNRTDYQLLIFVTLYVKISTQTIEELVALLHNLKPLTL